MCSTDLTGGRAEGRFIHFGTTPLKLIADPEGEFMSVDALLKDEQIQELLDRMLPSDPWPKMRLKAPALRNSSGLVGTAFDYAVRFELQRRNPGARTEPWVAEQVVDSVETIAGLDGTVERLDADEELISVVDGQLVDRWQRIVRNARAFVTSFVREANSSLDARREMACHALRLARLDPYWRIGHVEREPEKVEPADLRDLLQLLRLVPWNELGSSTSLWLNATFGIQSERVGGADCDLISDDLLMELKTTVTPKPKIDFRQLLAYLLLATAARAANADFPLIGRIGVYYARHRELVLLPIERLRGSVSLEAAQRRFLHRAEALYGDLPGPTDR